MCISEHQNGCEVPNWQALSKVHFMVFREQPKSGKEEVSADSRKYGVFLYDKSSNGTFVNGAKVCSIVFTVGYRISGIRIIQRMFPDIDNPTLSHDSVVRSTIFNDWTMDYILTCTQNHESCRNHNTSI